MRLIIEIPEEDYKRGTVMARAIRNGTPISDNATNLDVLIAVFPEVTLDNMWVNKDWAKKPYKGGE